jgi:hypothetical protein
MASRSDFDDLLTLLKSSDRVVRNRAARKLRELSDDRAVEPLLQAIHLAENRDDRGTLVYALRFLDCSGHFSDLFQLALHGNYEVQCKALAILEEQHFVVQPEELTKAEGDLTTFLVNPPPIERVEYLVAQLQTVLLRIGASGASV